MHGLVRSLFTGWHAEATEDLRAEVQGIADDFERRNGLPTTCVTLGAIPRADEARRIAVVRLVAVALTLAAVPGQLSLAITNDGPTPTRIVAGIGLTGATDRRD